MTSPVRIQRKRTKGWKMPPNTVYVGRPTKWGNIFNHEKLGRRKALSLYRKWMEGMEVGLYTPDLERLGVTPLGWVGLFLLRRSLIAEAKKDLRGKNLACWCPLSDRHGNAIPCHADVLLSIANDISIEEIQHENIRRAKREAT